MTRQMQKVGAAVAAVIVMVALVLSSGAPIDWAVNRPAATLTVGK